MMQEILEQMRALSEAYFKARGTMEKAELHIHEWEILHPLYAKMLEFEDVLTDGISDMTYDLQQHG